MIEVSAKYHGWYTAHILPELEKQREGALHPEAIDSDQIAIRSAQAQYALDEYRDRFIPTLGSSPGRRSATRGIRKRRKMF